MIFLPLLRLFFFAFLSSSAMDDADLRLFRVNLRRWQTFVTFDEFS